MHQQTHAETPSPWFSGSASSVSLHDSDIRDAADGLLEVVAAPLPGLEATALAGQTASSLGFVEKQTADVQVRQPPQRSLVSKEAGLPAAKPHASTSSAGVQTQQSSQLPDAVAAREVSTPAMFDATQAQHARGSNQVCLLSATLFWKGF